MTTPSEINDAANEVDDLIERHGQRFDTESRKWFLTAIGERLGMRSHIEYERPELIEETLPAGFTEGMPPPDFKCRMAFKGERGQQLWGEYDGSRVITDNGVETARDKITKWCVLPPDPPPLPRRFRCVRKSDGKPMVGAYFVENKHPYEVANGATCTMFCGEKDMNDQFTITEWIDPA
jgi:hypothetical protein